MGTRKDNTPEGLTGREANGRFMKGNKWATLKGIFESEEQLLDAVTEYFTSVARVGIHLKPTVTGLCFHCGFSTIQSFYDYEKAPEFSYTIKRARLFIQSCYEEKLYSRDWGGAAFALKNVGRAGDWTDEVVQHQKIETVKANFGVEKTDDAG